MTNGSASAPSAASTHGVHLFGVTLIGLTARNGHKLVLTIGFIAGFDEAGIAIAAVRQEAVTVSETQRRAKRAKS